jgi:hypothetical protein
VVVGEISLKQGINVIKNEKGIKENLLQLEGAELPMSNSFP